MKRILIITTGGTIACVKNYTGLSPVMSGEEMLDLLPHCYQFANLSFSNLMNLDSTNIQPEDWVRISNCIIDNADRYDGFVVLHGTDTMAYSAAAVSFMTVGVERPIVFTGAQIPLSSYGSDGIKNISDAIYYAAHTNINGVCIVFCGRIINGCSASKTDTFALDAFSSINTIDVGAVDSSRFYLNIDYKPNRTESMGLHHVGIDTGVLLIKLYPGSSPKLLDLSTVGCYKAVIIEAFGAGGVPALERSLLPQIEKIIKEGIFTVITSQCLRGGCDISIYEVGKNTERLGAVSAGTIGSEVLVAKMMWALFVTSDRKKLRKMLLTDYCGEFGNGHSY